MSFANEMMNLGEKLVASSENRINGTRKLLGKFHQDHRNMAKNQLDNLKEFTSALESNTEKTLKKFRNEHKEMAKDQCKKLGEFTDNLTHSVNGYMKKCHKDQMALRDMFDQAHENFTHCMREIAKTKRHSPAASEPESKAPRKNKKTKR